MHWKESVFSDKIPPPVITKEHGSWAVLFVPMLVNACVAGKLSLDFILVAITGLGAFLCYVPAQILLRHYSSVPQGVEKLRQARCWGIIYSLSTVCFASPFLREDMCTFLR